jgi:O-antigen/teichoic acid export membrane protein
VHLRTILRNVLSTWVGYAVTILVGFLMAPYVVHHLGNTGYGVWTLVMALTGYFGMLDIGIRQSVSRFVARYLALKDEDSVNRTVSTAIAMLAGGGLLALLATIALRIGFGVFHVGIELQDAAKTAMLLAGLNISLALPMSVFSATLIALERFDVITGVTILGAITRATLVVTFLNLGHGIVTLALIWLLVGFAEYLAMAICTKRLYRPLRLRWRYVERVRCKELFGFGIYRFIWIVANQLIFYSDSLVIGAFLNAAAITYFTIAGSLINYGRNIVSLATDTLYPAASRLDAQNDRAGLCDLLVFGARIGLFIGIPLCCGFLFLGHDFIALWMGPRYALSATILVILTIPQFTSMSQYISALILVGMARHKVLAFVALAEGAANLVLSILLVRKMGLIGVAWGTVVPHLISTSLVLPWYTLYALDMKPVDYFSRTFVKPLLAAIPGAVVCYALSVTVTASSWIRFAGEVAIVCAVFAVTTYLFCLSTSEKAKLRQLAQKVLQRRRVAEAATL